MRIRSVSELLEQTRSRCSEAEMFRGQLADWPLLPGIGRYPKIVKGYENWRVFHEHIVSRFTRLARPYFERGFMHDADAWVHAQHHGLPTRLMDWTTNPLKGLFFAVNDPKCDNENGVLWALTFASWREDLHEASREYWETELVPFLPEQLNSRLTAQEGCFLSYPLPAHRKPLTTVDELAAGNHADMAFVKFIVPAKVKRLLRRELAVFGGHYRLMFPDPDGVARGIKIEELEP